MKTRQIRIGEWCEPARGGGIRAFPFLGDNLLWRQLQKSCPIPVPLGWLEAAFGKVDRRRPIPTPLGWLGVITTMFPIYWGTRRQLESE